MKDNHFLMEGNLILTINGKEIAKTNPSYIQYPINKKSKNWDSIEASLTQTQIKGLIKLM